MAENKGLLFNSAMVYGLVLGLFWAIKYLLFMFGYNSSMLSLLYMTLAPVTLLIAYTVTRKYQFDLGGKISFGHAWQFGVLVYLFAALIVSIPHYIFYRFVAPPGFIEQAYESTIQVLRDTDISARMLEYAENMSIPTPIGMAIQDIFNNIFYGILFSLPIAYICSRKNLPGANSIDTQK